MCHGHELFEASDASGAAVELWEQLSSLHHCAATSFHGHKNTQRMMSGMRDTFRRDGASPSDTVQFLCYIKSCGKTQFNSAFK